MRSLLFVPADSPRKLARGMASGADALILDLEDSVAPDGKSAARDIAAGFLRETVPQRERPVLIVRVNALDTGLTDADLDAVVGARPDGILLPKAEGGASVNSTAVTLASFAKVTRAVSAPAESLLMLEAGMEAVASDI